MDAASPPHPNDRTLSAFGLGKLDGDAARAIDDHLNRCDACRQRVASLSADSFLDRVRGAGTSQTGKTTAPPPADTLPPGLADNPDYEVKKELGRGGMGVVYLVHNTLLGRDEVLKVIGRHLIERPGVLERFLREIRAVARLRHDNIVSAYSASRLGDAVAFSMEYVDGLDLARLARAKGPLPVAHAANFVHQAALGLQHAHEEGLVHRDIKPANLMLARRGARPVVKVLDFGLAKAAREEKVDGALTSTGQALGTPDYIAPEQILDAPSADVRADVYSLGGTLYYLLTGRPPFKANSLYDLYQAHISRDADPLNLVRPEVPSELAALVTKMLAKDPSRRFQTPGEVAEALKPFFKRAGTRVPQPRPAAFPGLGTGAAAASHLPATELATDAVPPTAIDVTRLDTRTDGSDGGTTPTTGETTPRRSRWHWPAAVAGLFLLGGASAWLATAYRSRSPEDKTVLENPLKNSATPKAESGVRSETTVGGQEVRVPDVPRGERAGLSTETAAVEGRSAAGIDEARGRSPSVLDDTARRFQPGATWVGTWTFEPGETLPASLTVTRRSGDHFDAAGTLIHLNQKEAFSVWSGTLSGNRVEARYEGTSGAHLTISGTIEGREFRLTFRGTNGNNRNISGRVSLAYQGPAEARPVSGGVRPPAAVEGAERLALLGHWEHYAGNQRYNIEFMSNGTIRRTGVRGTWALAGDRLTLVWPTSQSGTQAWTDAVVLTEDRTRYRGANQSGLSIKGSRLGPGGHGAMPTINYDPGTEATPRGAAPGPQTGGVGRLFESRADPIGGAWSIDGDELVQTDLGGRNSGAPYLVFGNDDLSHYDLTLEAMKTGGTEAFFVHFHRQDRANKCQFSLGRYGNAAHDLERFVEGRNEREEDDYAESTIETGRWYRIKVEVRGSAYRCFLDDRLLFATTDPRLDHGRIGLACWESQVRYRKIEVRDPNGAVLFQGLPKLPAVIPPAGEGSGLNR